MSTSTLDIIVLTVLATILIGVVVFFLVKGFRSLWTLLTNILAALLKTQIALRESTTRVYEARLALVAVQGELAFMRSMTQPSPNFGHEAPQPPLGHAGVMPGPPPFPAPVWDRYAPSAPDATPEDTPMDLIEQDDRDVQEAQTLEYLRSKGIEPDEGDEPQPAVIDEA